MMILLVSYAERRGSKSLSFLQKLNIFFRNTKDNYKTKDNTNTVMQLGLARWREKEAEGEMLIDFILI